MIKRGLSDIKKIKDLSTEEVQNVMEENIGCKKGTGSRKEKTNEKIL